MPALVGGLEAGQPAAVQTAGVEFVDLLTGRTGEPQAVLSGNGQAAVAAFDPRWVADAVR